MFKKIYIEITNICNLKCAFCPDSKRAKRLMSVEEFESVVSKISNHTKLVYLHVKGEPLLHPDLDSILSILEKYNLKTNITTNGTLISDKIEILKKSKAIRQINISIHSFTQNKVLKSDYLNNIFKAVEQLDDVIISYRLWNLGDFNKNDINEDLIEKLETYYNIKDLKQILKDNQSFKLSDNIYINQDIEFTWPDINGKNIIQNGKCLALKDQIAILVDGTVVPCCLDNNGDIPLGNIFNETIEEILNKPLTILIKENFKKNIITCDLCKTCGFLKRLESKRKK